MSRPQKLSPTSYALLGLLARQPQSAYELTTAMQSSVLRAFWPRAQSHVYSEPKKLLTHGLVTERKATQAGRERTVYRITADGQQALQHWLNTAGEADLRLQSEAMLKLVLADSGTLAQARATLQATVTACEEDLSEAITGIEAILEDTDAVSAGMPFNGFAMNLVADLLSARLKWSQHALARCEELEHGYSVEERGKAGIAAYREALKTLRKAAKG